MEQELNEHNERVGVYDIRWHKENGHLIGSYVLKGSERDARAFAAGKLSRPAVFTVRVLAGSFFLYTFKRG